MTYARIDGFDPKEDYVEPEGRSLMDRWALSELQLTIRTVSERLDAYDVTAAGRAIGEFVDELSNWYVRRSRRRFWKGEDDQDKKAAHSTLYECLVTVTKLTAPFTPFVAESLYQNLVVNGSKGAPESVHLADWPEYREELVDRDLSERMSAARRVVGLGRAARNAAAIKTRQPLREVVVVDEAPDGKGSSRVKEGVESLKEIVLDELNVKELAFGEAEDVVAYDLKPNLGVVGPSTAGSYPDLARPSPRLRPRSVPARLRERASPWAWKGRRSHCLPRSCSSSQGRGKVTPWSARGASPSLFVRDSTPELVDEGLVRELVHRVQNLRREKGFEIEESIRVGLSGNPRVRHFWRITGEITSGPRYLQRSSPRRGRP